MPFEIDKGDTYEWIVSLGEPDKRSAKPETFTAVFRRLSQPRIDQINEAIRQRMIAARAGEVVEGMIDDMQLADEVLAGWSGITSNGQPVEFSESLKAELLSRASFAAFVVAAWNESILAGRKKTSKTPPGLS